MVIVVLIKPWLLIFVISNWLVISVDAGHSSSDWSQWIKQADDVSVQGHASREMIDRAQDSAIVLAGRALEEATRIAPPDPDIVSSILHRMGRYYYRRGDVQIADSLWTSSVILARSDSTSAVEYESSILCIALAHRRSTHLLYTPLAREALAILDSVDRGLDTSAVSRSWKLVELAYRLGLYTEMEQYTTHTWQTYQQIGGDAYSAMRALIHQAEGLSKLINKNTPNQRSLQDSAVKIGTLALDLVERAFEPADTNIAFVLQRLGDYEMRQGNRVAASVHWERAWNINRVKLPAEHIEHQGSLTRMISLSRSRGQYLEAERLARLAVELRTATQGPNHTETASMYMTLGNICYQVGKVEEAERCYRTALKIRRSSINQVPEDVAGCYSKLAILASELGDFVAAEKHLQSALAICRRSLGEQHVFTLDIQDQLTLLYRNWGVDSCARLSSQLVLAGRGRFLGDNHPSLLEGIVELAAMYARGGDRRVADSLSHRADQIARHAMDTAGVEFARVLFSRAKIDMLNGQFTEARKKLEGSTAVLEFVLGDTAVELLPAYTALGMTKESLGDNISADQAYLRAERTLARNAHLPRESISDALEILSQHKLKVNQPAAAFAYASIAFRRRMDRFTNGARMLSRNEAVRFQRQVLRARDLMINGLFSESAPPTEHLASAASAIVATKGWITDELCQRENQIRHSTDTVVLLLADSLQSERSRLSTLYVQLDGPLSTTGSGDSIRLVSERIESLEKSIALRNARYNTSGRVGKATIDSVRRWLPPDGALVEYFDYRPQPEESAESRYGVLCLTRDTLLLVDLARSRDVDSIVSRYRSHMERIVANGLMPSDGDVADYRIVAEDLSRFLWTPVTHIAGRASTVFISPEGSLSFISFAGLPATTGYLVETAVIQYVRSGRSLASTPSINSVGLLAVGDPDFDHAVQENAMIADRSDPDDPFDNLLRESLDECAVLRNRNLDRLRGSGAEVTNATALWRRSVGTPAFLLTGAQATEPAFRTMAPQYSVLHVATHAYTIGSSCTDTISSVLGESNSLLSSGFFLAGAKLRGRDAKDDGVLTSLEISMLDLSGVQTVILSGCRTAQGVMDVEGVVGLVHSFNLAGAKTVIGSLWPVGDNTSVEFMRSLYRHAHETTSSNLRRAQLDLLQKLRKDGRPDHPALWAPFVAYGPSTPLAN